MNPYYLHSSPCPTCGHCPACGRGWAPPSPWVPHWTPYPPNYFTLTTLAGPAPVGDPFRVL